MYENNSMFDAYVDSIYHIALGVLIECLRRFNIDICDTDIP
jgi:hypothetical protein